MTEHLLESVEDGVATLTMNRPEARNAMSGEMMGALREAADRVAVDPQVRCVVLTGAGGAFCAGGDVKGQARAASARRSGERVSVPARVHGLRSGMELSRLLHEMPKPTLAVIPGAAAGAGLGANALVGGGNSFALQPFSISGQKGVNIAAGLVKLSLKAAN